MSKLVHHPKCKNCTSPNCYGDRYDGFCLQCHNAGVPELMEQIADRDRQLAELRRENEAMRGGIRYWSFCTRQGMLKWCPEKDAELREFHRVLGIYPDATDPDAGLPTLHDLRGILKPKEADRAAKE